MSDAQGDNQFMASLVMQYPLLQCIRTACELNIAELLQDASMSCSQLASQTNTNADFLYRVMRCLVSHGIFCAQTTATPECLFSHSARSRLLLGNVQGLLKDSFLIQLGGEHLAAVSHLTPVLQEHKDACSLLYGMKVWDVYKHKMPQRGHLFNQFMTSFSALFIPMLVEAYDYSARQVIVDVGGGHGHLLRAILNKHSLQEQRGIVFDLPQVVADLKEEPNLQYVGGSFFDKDSIPANADLYLMKWILHDYQDAEAMQILKHMHRAMKKESRLLIMESIISSDMTKVQPAKHLDIVMMTVASGKERTEEEFSHLVQSCQLQVEKIYHLPAVGMSILECSKQ